MVRTLSKSQKNKNFTLRLHPDDADAIRARASALGMSQSYYISCIFRLELKYDLVNEFLDPLVATEGSSEAGAEAGAEAEKPDLDPAEAAAMIERLRSGGFIAQDIPPAAPETDKPAHVRPIMRTREDLLRISRGGPDTGTPAERQAALSGSVGDVQMEIRNAQLRAVEEEREERKMRKKILEEQVEDLPIAEWDEDEDGNEEGS